MAIDVHGIQLFTSAAFLIEGPAGLALIDAGLPGSTRRIYREIEALEYRLRDLNLVVITHMHPDHAGCLPALLRDSEARLAAHPLAEKLRGRPVRLPPARKLWGKVMAMAYRPFRPLLSYPDVAVDLPLEDGAGLAAYGLPATVMHTPGHTADSITLLLEDGTAFVGDLLVSVNGRLVPQPYFVENERTLNESVERLRARQPRVIHAAHSTKPMKPPWKREP